MQLVGEVDGRIGGNFAGECSEKVMSRPYKLQMSSQNHDSAQSALIWSLDWLVSSICFNAKWTQSEQHCLITIDHAHFWPQQETNFAINYRPFLRAYNSNSDCPMTLKFFFMYHLPLNLSWVIKRITKWLTSRDWSSQ